MTFPGPPKIPLAPPRVRWVISLAENESHIHPNMCATFGCGPTVVSKKEGTDRLPDKWTLQLYIYSRRVSVLPPCRSSHLYFTCKSNNEWASRVFLISKISNEWQLMDNILRVIGITCSFNHVQGSRTGSIIITHRYQLKLGQVYVYLLYYNTRMTRPDILG